MKFREIYWFELKFQFRRYVLWIFFTVVLSLVVLSVTTMFDNVERGEYFLNSPIAIALIATLSTLLGMTLSAAVSGSAAVRDLQTGMDPLMYTTAIKKPAYLGGRFLASFTINLLVVFFILFLLMLIPLLPVPQHYFTEFNLASYAGAVILFAIPNVFITTGIIFSLGVLSRKAMAGFLAAALLFFTVLMTMDIVAGELGKWELGKKIDFSGMTILKEKGMADTPLQMQGDLVEVNGFLVIHRLGWMGVAGAFLALAYFNFGFVHHNTKSRKRKINNYEKASGKEKIIWETSVSAPVDERVFDNKTALEQAVFLTWSCFKDLIRAKVWLILPLTALIMIYVGEEVLEGQLGVSMVPTTWRVITLFNFFIAVKLVVIILTTFYAGELVWKDRDARINEIADATPVSNWLLFISKLGSLILMLLMAQFLFMISGITIQLIQGYYEIDVLLYLKTMLGLGLVDYLIFAVVALFVHVLVNHKYVGHLLVFVACYYMFFPEELNLQHHLLIFGSGPSWSYSEISGFEPFLFPWFLYKIYWMGWAFLLALLTGLFWNRGKENLFGRRIKKAKLYFSGTTRKVSFPVLILISILGGYLFYNTNILNTYVSADEISKNRALYEKYYGKFKNVSQPLLTGVKLEGEIYPEKREAVFFGTYQLINKTESVIDTLHVATNSNVFTDKVKFSRNTETIMIDTKLGHQIYKLQTPLQPGDSVSMNFKVHFRENGFTNAGLKRAVVGNGTYLGYHNMPGIGYERDREIGDSLERKKYGLNPRPAIRSVNSEEAKMDMEGEHNISFEALLGTSVNQTAITAGTLNRSWIKNNRRYSHFTTDVPIRHNYEIFSAVYEVHKAAWRDVEIQIYYHPEHFKNLGRMVEGVKASLEYFSDNFSPYPHSQIRLVEYPGSGVGLNGNPVTMSYSEGFSLLAPENDHFHLNFPFAVIGHEVAHQWWGGELRPAYAEGGALLTESLAWYSSMVVVEKTYGPEHLNLLMRVMRQEFLTPRSIADVPLIRATDKFSVYRKGPFAMYALKEYIGEKKINVALKSLLDEFGDGEPPLAVSLDLYQKLEEVTPDSLQYLLKDLFLRNSFWKLSADKATVEEMPSGKWKVSFDVDTEKVSVDEKGVETELPVMDYIEIGIYGNSPEGDLGEVLHLKKHRLKKGKQRLEITVGQKPDLAGIDPNRLLIDRDMKDNFAEIAQ